MVSQAIILAAGKGSRLSKYTTNVPKALLPIKYGETIIERMVNQLINNGISEIVVVLGYQSDNAIKFINNLSVTNDKINISSVINYEFGETGTLKSLLIGVNTLTNKNKDFIVIEGDVVCDDIIINMLVNTKGNIVAGDSSSELDDEAMKYTINKNNNIQSISKELSNELSNGEALGLVHFDASLLDKVYSKSKIILQRNKYAFYEEVINDKEIDFKLMDICNNNWTEVDFPLEYKKARQIFSESEKIKIDYSLFEQTTHSPSIFELIGDLDIEIKDFCFLANPYLLNDSFIEEISLELKQLFSTYPPIQHQLQKSVSKFHNKKIFPENIAVGNGATELIDIINFTSAGSIVPIPTFSEYIDSVNNLITYQLSEKKDYNLDIKDFIEFCKKHDSKKFNNIIIINPNNPIGRYFKKKEIIEMVKNLDEFNVIVDESFLDFSDSKQSVLDEIYNYNNLIVVKSFGKTLGMPGARLGAIYSNSLYIKRISKSIPIWNVNCLASYILHLMSKNDFKKRLNESIEKVKNDTIQLYRQLNKIPYLKAYKPTANFVIAKLTNGMSARKLRDSLLEEKIFIRDCSNKIGLGKDYVRIASRTNRENGDISRHIEMIIADFGTK